VGDREKVGEALGEPEKLGDFEVTAVRQEVTLIVSDVENVVLWDGEGVGEDEREEDRVKLDEGVPVGLIEPEGDTEVLLLDLRETLEDPLPDGRDDRRFDCEEQADDEGQPLMVRETEEQRDPDGEPVEERLVLGDTVPLGDRVVDRVNDGEWVFELPVERERVTEVETVPVFETEILRVTEGERLGILLLEELLVTETETEFVRVAELQKVLEGDTEILLETDTEPLVHLDCEEQPEVLGDRVCVSVALADLEA